MKPEDISSFVRRPAQIVFILALCTVTARAAGTETVLYSFSGVAHGDGGYPNPELVFDHSGNIYGTTSAGGSNQCANGCGTVFELTPISGGWSETILYEFVGSSDGLFPESGPIFDAAGNLYGTTFEVGSGTKCSDGCGTVYELSPNGNGGWTKTIIYDFTGGADGGLPIAGLIFDGAGNLYGTTVRGGGAVGRGLGTVFELVPNGVGGWLEVTLHQFHGEDGAHPQGRLTLGRLGELYGTTFSGGRHDRGTVFKLAQSGLYEILHSFKGFDGEHPAAGVTFDKGGNIYGTTEEGGNDGGTVFELSETNGTWVESVIQSYGFPIGTEPFDGGVTIDGSNRLLASASHGGVGHYGTVFGLAPNGSGGWQATILHDFAGGSDGRYPDTHLAVDAQGVIYGTTQLGGVGVYGVVFEITP